MKALKVVQALITMTFHADNSVAIEGFKRAARQLEKDHKNLAVMILETDITPDEETSE